MLESAFKRKACDVTVAPPGYWRKQQHIQRWPIRMASCHLLMRFNNHPQSRVQKQRNSFPITAERCDTLEIEAHTPRSHFLSRGAAAAPLAQRPPVDDILKDAEVGERFFYFFLFFVLRQSFFKSGAAAGLWGFLV